MTEKLLQSIIGSDATRNVREMGGVMSRLRTQGISSLVLGRLTAEEGLNIFKWAIEAEAKIEQQTDPEEWRNITRDSMQGQLLRDRGEEWFKQAVNEIAIELGKDPLYT